MADPEPPSYKVKRTKFHGNDAQLFMQNVNGPCPLLAIANILSLRELLRELPREMPDISQSRLVSLVAGHYLDSNKVDESSEMAANLAANLHDGLEVLHKLTTGIDVNVRFNSIHGFEPTREVTIFDLLDISLVHGWLVDPQDAHTSRALGSKSYNELVELLVLALGQEAASRLPSRQTTATSATTHDLLAAAGPSTASADYQQELEAALRLSLEGPSASATPTAAAPPTPPAPADDPTPATPTSSTPIPADTPASPPAVTTPAQEPSAASALALDTPPDSAAKAADAVVDGLVRELTDELDAVAITPATPKPTPTADAGTITPAPTAPSADAPAPSDSPTLPPTPAPAADEPAAATTTEAPSPAAPVADPAAAAQPAMPRTPTAATTTATATPSADPAADSERLQQALAVRTFLEGNCNQLTVHGLEQLHAQLKEHQLAVFFRNNHFSTLYKHEGALYLLVTDQGYLMEPDVVWERLDTVDGDTQLCDAAFRPFRPHRDSLPADLVAGGLVGAGVEGGDLDPETLAAISSLDDVPAATAAILPPGAVAAGPTEDADFALALQLQEQEEQQFREQQLLIEQQQLEQRQRPPQQQPAQQAGVTQHNPLLQQQQQQGGGAGAQQQQQQTPPRQMPAWLRPAADAVAGVRPPLGGAGGSGSGSGSTKEKCSIM